MDAHKIIYSLCCGVIGAGLGCYGMSIYHEKELEFCKENRKLMEAVEIVNDNYYQEIPKERIQESIVNGYIDGLNDRFSVYNTEDELTEQGVNYAESTLTMGFKICLDKKTWNILLEKVKKGSLAENAGLMTGDIIYEVNGRNVRNEGYYNVIDELTGKEGKELKLKIIRNGAKIEKVVILKNSLDNKKDKIILMENDIVYYKTLAFDPYSNTNSFENGLAEIGGNVNPHKLIIDLRDNLGGDPEEPIRFFDMFDNTESSIKLVSEKTGQMVEYKTTQPAKYNFDTVVLVSSDTYSSAESLTALFKDNNLATIVGTQTGGKGVFQKNYMFDGIGDLSVVEGYYYINDMPNYNNVGIEPDIIVEMDPDLRGTDEDIQLQKAIELLS